MSRRDRIDPETARLVEERLQWLLRENGPEPSAERARPGTKPTAGPPTKPERPARAGDTAAHAVPPRGRVRRPRSSESGDIAPSGTALLKAVGSLRRPHLIVVGTLVALGILLAGWAVLRARPVAVAVTPPPVISTRAGSGSSAGASETAGGPSAVAPPVIVHVLGAVRKPGLVTLAAGSRVQDALEAAGGLTGKADPGELNLAQPVTDGQQIVVGTKGKPSGEVRDGSSAAGGSASGSGGAGGAGQQVNLNTAGQAQLEELPGVGPVMAGKIIAWRTEHGRFSRVEELQEIDGVGPKTYAELAPLCRV